VARIQGMYLGESGTIYFVQEDFENSIENDKKICYNNNVNKKVAISKNEMKIEEQEENPFINLDFDWGL
jgi:hypothetical protein